MKKEYMKCETQTTVITDDSCRSANPSAANPSGLCSLSVMIPGFDYPGSARIDEQGNFEFRPRRRSKSKNNNMRVLRSGQLEGTTGLRWDVLGGPHSMKISLTIRDAERLLARPQLITEAMHSLFVQAMCELTRIL